MASFCPPPWTSSSWVWNPPEESAWLNNLNKKIGIIVLILPKMLSSLLYFSKGQARISASLTAVFIIYYSFRMNPASSSPMRRTAFYCLGTVRVMAFISRCSFTFLSALVFMKVPLKHKRGGVHRLMSHIQDADPRRGSHVLSSAGILSSVCTSASRDTLSGSLKS